MNAAPFAADAFGFTQAASRISTTLMDTANHVGFAIKRSAALLRAVHFQLLNDDPRNLNAFDVETLLELIRAQLAQAKPEVPETITFPVEVVRRASVQPPRTPRPKVPART